MLTPAELTLIADEIQRLPLPARVDRIHEPRADRIVIRLESGGAAADLLITTARPFPRAHFVTGRAPNPRTPPPFCEDLRRILMPGALVRATTPPHDATLALEFEVRIDDGPRVRRTLVAELFGAHPNILVIDDRDRILAVLRPRDSEVRRLMPGATYE